MTNGLNQFVESFAESLGEQVERIVEVAENKGASNVYFLDSIDCVMCGEQIRVDFLINVIDYVGEFFIFFICPRCAREKENDELKNSLLHDTVGCLYERGEFTRVGGRE